MLNTTHYVYWGLIAYVMFYAIATTDTTCYQDQVQPDVTCEYNDARGNVCE